MGKFWENGGIYYISFGTHPEKSYGQIGKGLWLVISGSHSEAGKGLGWQTSYRFVDSSVRKQQELVNGVWQTPPAEGILDKTDFNLVGTILGKMSETTQVWDRLLNKSNY